MGVSVLDVQLLVESPPDSNRKTCCFQNVHSSSISLSICLFLLLYGSTGVAFAFIYLFIQVAMSISELK